MEVASRSPLQWGLIVLTAVLASVVVLLVLLVSIQLFPAWWLAFCPAPACPDLGCVIAWFFSCLVVLTITFLVIDVLAVAIAAALLIWPRVPDRRLTYVVLTVVISTVLNIAIVYLFSVLT